MKNRSIPMVVILSLVTFGIYVLVWYYQTKEEMRESGRVQSVPSLWLLLIPFVGGLIFMWQYGAAVETVTNGKYSQVITLVMLLFLSIIGIAILQSAYNEIGEGKVGSSDPFGANA